MNGSLYGWPEGQAHPGLSALESVIGPPAVYAQMSTVPSYTSGTPVILPWTVQVGHVVVLFTAAAVTSPLVTSVSLAGVVWVQLCGTAGGSPNQAQGSLWMGLVQAAGANSLTIVGPPTNAPCYYAFEMSGLVGHADAAAAQLNTTPVSISPSVLNPSGAIVAAYYDRAGAIVGPTEGSPWVSILPSTSAAGAGFMAVAWRPVLAAGIVAATFTGRTDNAIECLGAII